MTSSVAVIQARCFDCTQHDSYHGNVTSAHQIKRDGYLNNQAGNISAIIPLRTYAGELASLVYEIEVSSCNRPGYCCKASAKQSIARFIVS